jgi:murein DD-endopeptidase MepM/ murein hydrolase activator NlpD
MTTTTTSKRARTLVLVLAGIVLAVLFGSAVPAKAQDPSIRPICFPVVEPVYFTDSFGAPRAGHRHQGNDLMGEKGYHLVAPADAVIVDLRGPGTGHSDFSIRLQDAEGWFYAYLHMNDDTWGTDDGAAPVEMVFAPGLAVGSTVRAGQFIGYMGDSGNAEGGTAHLHFEIRQPADNLWNAAAVDPYASLLAAPHCPDPTVVVTPPPPPVIPAANHGPRAF